MTDEDLKRYADAKVREFSMVDFQKNPQEAFEASNNGMRVIIRDHDGSVCFRMSPEFND